MRSSREEIEARRRARRLRERQYIMGATSISDDIMNGNYKENKDPVEWAKKFFEGVDSGKIRIREGNRRFRENSGFSIKTWEVDEDPESFIRAIDEMFDEHQFVMIEKRNSYSEDEEYVVQPAGH